MNVFKFMPTFILWGNSCSKSTIKRLNIHGRWSSVFDVSFERTLQRLLGIAKWPEKPLCLSLLFWEFGDKWVALNMKMTRATTKMF